MINKNLVELCTKVATKKAEREDFHEFTQIMELIRANGATNPQTHWKINEIITKTANEIMKPKLDFMDYIAQTQNVGHGQKIEWDVPKKNQMTMQWSARGTTVDYQRVNGKKRITSNPEAISGGAQYDIDQLLSGNVKEFEGVVAALVESMENAITNLVMGVLNTAMLSAPAANKVSAANPTSTQFDAVASVIQRYDRNVAFIADLDFAKKVAKYVDASYLSDRLKELRNNSGYLTTVNGVDIVVFNNPFAADDTDNTKYSVSRQNGFFVPAGAEKPVKVGFEGELEQYTATDINTERVFLKAVQKVSVDAFTDLRNIGRLTDTAL